MAGGQKVVGVYIGKRRLSVQTTLPGSLFTATFVSSEKEDSDTQLPPGQSQPSQNPHQQVDMACQLESVSLFHR